MAEDFEVIMNVENRSTNILFTYSFFKMHTSVLSEKVSDE